MFYLYGHENWWKRLEQIYLENIWVFTSRHNCHIYSNMYRIGTQASQVPSSTTMLSNDLPQCALSSRWVFPLWNCFIDLLIIDSLQQPKLYVKQVVWLACFLILPKNMDKCSASVSIFAILICIPIKQWEK